MVTPADFPIAAAPFALGPLFRAIRDAVAKNTIASAYSKAACNVVEHYEERGFRHPSEEWKAILRLLKSKQCGECLSLGKPLSDADIIQLQAIYGRDRPELLDVISQMIGEIIPIARGTLPGPDKTLAGIFVSLNSIQAALATKRHAELRGDHRDIHGAIEAFGDRLSNERVVGIGGTGGVGKSLLAAHYARLHYPENALYVSLDSGTSRSRMVELGKGLNIEFAPEHTDGDMSRMLKMALEDYEGLLIIDNAEDEDDIRLLLPSPSGRCIIIITARDQALLKRVTGTSSVEVDEFSPEEAEDCFRVRTGQDLTEHEKSAIHDLCRLLGYLPIAVDLSAATIASKGIPVADWLAAYPDERKLLEELSGDWRPVDGIADEEARRRKMVGAVLRISLRDLSPLASRLLNSVACFDPATGGPESIVLTVAEVSSEEEALARVQLNNLHQRSVLRLPAAGVGGQRYTMHRLMREVVQEEFADETKASQTRYFDIYAAFPELLSRTVSEERSTVALALFWEELPNLDIVERLLVGEAPSTPEFRERRTRQRAEFAVHVAQFTMMAWPFGRLRVLLEKGLDDSRTGEWGWLQANTLQALGDLEMREARLGQARSRYEEALPIYRDIQARMGEANTVQASALIDSMEGKNDEAVEGFHQALEIHEEIMDGLGVRADLGYLGRHYLRNDRPVEALQAFEASLNALPRAGDPLGYGMSLRGQLEAFAKLENVVGILACLRLLADIGEGLEEPFANLLSAIKEQSADTDFTDLENALATDADSVRRAAVQQVIRGSSTEDSSES